MANYLNDRILERAGQSFADCYTEMIFPLLEKNRKLILGDADLGRAILGPRYRDFKAAHPEQMFDVGLQEANLVGVCCGLAVVGMLPVAHSFAAFITRRVFDTLFVSGAYSRLNLKLIGSDPGVTSAYNGGTHMTFEDVALLRCVPNTVIFEPADLAALKTMFPKLLKHEGVCYMRIPRAIKPLMLYPENADFEIGRANRLRQGKDATIIAFGTEVPEAVKAAELLKNEGMDVRVLDIVTVKPIDSAAIIAAARETGAIVTAENHSLHGGLFSAVCEVLAQSKPCAVEPVGIAEEFGEVGSYDELLDRFKLTAESIAAAVKRCLARK